MEGAEPVTATARPQRERSGVFISYCRADQGYLDRLLVHLKPLKKAGIRCWSDTDMQQGRWREQIDEALETASLAIFLVSPDFLASDFVTTIEIPSLLKAAKNQDLGVTCVILKPCDFASSALSEYQAINDPKLPLCDLPEGQREACWVRVTGIVRSQFKPPDGGRGLAPVPPVPPARRKLVYWSAAGLVLAATALGIWYFSRAPEDYFASRPNDSNKPDLASLTCGSPAGDGAWRASGNCTAVLPGLRSAALYNFEMFLKTKITGGIRWGLRTQNDRRSGYEFQLRRLPNGLAISGLSRKGDAEEGMQVAAGRSTIPFSPALRNDDTIEITTRSEGPVFTHFIVVQAEDVNDEREYLGRCFPVRLRDSAGNRWPYGGASLISTGDPVSVLDWQFAAIPPDRNRSKLVPSGCPGL